MLHPAQQISRVTIYCLDVYAEYIMRNDGLDEAQVGIKIANRNINNLRYADDTYHPYSTK